MSTSEGLPGLASAVLVATGALEIVRAAVAPPFPSLCEWASLALRLVLTGVWLIAAILLPLRARVGPLCASCAGRLAWLTLVVYGVAETVLRVGDGSMHLVAAMIVAAAVERPIGAVAERAGEKLSARGG